MFDELAVRAVDSLNRNYGGTHGHRAAHAKGFCLSGGFRATPEAASLTRALPFQGDEIPVTVRFSNGSGASKSADHHVDGRGMAVKLHLPGGAETDIVALSQHTFFVKTPEDFLEFTLARQSDAATGRPDPNAIGDFLIRHPEAESALTEVMVSQPPVSYAQVGYHGLHAFRWADSEGGARYVRYHWVPDAGEASLTREDAKSLGPDYLRTEMLARLAGGPVAFQLELQIAEEGDDVDDPTHEWPADRRRVVAGHLRLERFVDDQDGGCERRVFDPMRLTDGIEASDDPILNFRTRAYDVSASRRLA